MPIYEYRCDSCGHQFDVFQKFSDPPVETCERCGGPVSKVLHPVAVHFKGSGFYTTDYGRGSARRPGGKEETGGEAAKDAGEPAKAAATTKEKASGGGETAKAKKASA